MERMFKIVKYTFLLAVVGVAVFAARMWFFGPKTSDTNVQGLASQAANVAASDAAGKVDSSASAAPIQNANSSSNNSVNTVVPFTVQAPSGNWSDPVYQNGCEEASALMAMSWVQGKTSIDPNFAQSEIKNISDYETKIFGLYEDTSVDDVATFIRGYFNYNSISVQKNISSADIIAQLQKGNILIVPMFGQALGNPHFTSPGPVEHMLVVTGYDSTTQEFITNDPGTKFGQGYRYPVSVFMDAIWMYPTSSTPQAYPGSANAQKAMIVVSK